MSRPRSIRHIACLLLLVAGLGTAAAAAPIASPAGEEGQATPQTIPVPQGLVAPARQERQDEVPPVTAPAMVRTDEDAAARARNRAAFLRSMVAGPEAAEVLAMVAAAFRGSGGSSGWIPLGSLCDGDDVCGLATLPDFTLLAAGAGKPEAALAWVGTVAAADPLLDLQRPYHRGGAWGGAGGGAAPALAADGAARHAEPPTLRALMLEVLAIFGLDEVARTLWNMPPPFIVLMLVLLLLGMVVIGRWVPARRHP